MASKRNTEGYYDPTAYEALAKIEREAKAHAFRPMVYICSPLSGNITANQRNARRYCRFAVDSGCIPLKAPSRPSSPLGLSLRRWGQSSSSSAKSSRQSAPS